MPILVDHGLLIILCCVTSDSCSIEHTLASEDSLCRSLCSHPSFETPLIAGLQCCPFDFYTFEYGQCANSRVNDRAKSVGDYGKPRAEFQSVTYDTFSMTVMWEHRAGELLSSFPDLSTVQGYTRLESMKRKLGALKKLDNAFVSQIQV